MKTNWNKTLKIPAMLLSASVTIALGHAVQAKGLAETTGAWDAAFPSVNKPEFMKNLGLSVGGWANAGISTNTNSSPDRFNGPVGLNDRDAEPQVNQIYLFLKREVDKQGNSWDFGGRFDFLYGTDAFIAQSTDQWDRGLITTGTSRFYNIALPQLYGEVFAPIGNGLTAKIGHFYGLTNYESVMSPNNFFYSRSNSFTWDGPFTHTGVLLSYPITSNVSITGGGVMGWDNFNKDMSNWNFLGKIGWTSDDKKIATHAAVVTGDKSSDEANLTRYTVTYEHEFIDRLRYVLQHTYGIQHDDPTRAGKDTTWYGVQNYLFYDLDDQFGFGLRGEWNRDQDGVRYRLNDRAGSLPVGIGSSYYEVTAGMNWKPLKWITVRPEVRYDWADKADAFDAGKRASQFMFATDVVVRF